MVGSKAGSGNTDLENELVAHLRRSDGYTGMPDVITTVRRCLAEVAGDLAPAPGAPVAAPLPVLEAAARWAREGVALETVLTACHDGARDGLEFLAARMAGPAVVDAARLLARVVEVVTTAIAAAYLDEHRIVAREHQTSAQTMVAALLSGHGVAALAKRAGIRVAPAYQIVALSIPPHPEEDASGPEAVSAARRKLRRVQAALGRPLGSRSLSLLRADGGTVLIPLESPRADHGGAGVGVMSAEVLQLVAEAAEVRPTAAVTSGTTAQIPELAGRAHEVLDRLCVTGRPPGLYRITDDRAIEPDVDRPEATRLRRLPPTAGGGARLRPGKPGAA